MQPQKLDTESLKEMKARNIGALVKTQVNPDVIWVGNREDSGEMCGPNGFIGFRGIG